MSLPYALAFDGTGNLFVGNRGTAGSNNTVTIEKFTPDGVGSVFATTGSGSPTGLAFDSLGNLYLARHSLPSALIEKFTPDGVKSVFADRSSGLGEPWGLAFDNANNLFVTNISNNSSQSTIWKFTVGGVRSSFLGPINGFNPQGLAFDSGGNVFVASNGSKIVEFTPAGVSSVFSDFTTTNGRGVIEIAIRPGLPVPEPATFSLLAVSSLFLAARRRRSV